MSKFFDDDFGTSNNNNNEENIFASRFNANRLNSFASFDTNTSNENDSNYNDEDDPKEQNTNTNREDNHEADEAVNEEEERIMRLEREAMRKELDFLLRTETPAQWKLLKEYLKKSISKLSMSKDKSMFTDAQSKQLQHESEKITFEKTTGNSLIKGAFTINGYQISSGQFFLKLARFNKGHEMKPLILPSNPFILEQVQRSHHLAESAYERLNKIDIDDPSSSASTNNNNNHGDTDTDTIFSTKYRSTSPTSSYYDISNADSNSLYTVMQVLEEVMLIIQNSKEELGFSQKNKLSSMSILSHNRLQKRFHPELPPEVILNFTVDDGQLLVSVYGVSFSDISTLKSTSMNSGSSGSSSDMMDQSIGSDKGKMISYTDNSGGGEVFGQVAEHVSIHCKVEFIRSALEDLSCAFKICARLRDKLLVHSYS